MRRLELMLWSLIVPEMIIFWALRQWIGSRRLAKTYAGTPKVFLVNEIFS